MPDGGGGGPPRMDPGFVPDPLDYPFPPATASGLLLDDYVAPLRLATGSAAGAGVVDLEDGRSLALDELLAAQGLASCANRTLVVAVGSNAAPAVLLRKFHRAGASTVVPLLRCSVGGLGLGYSAHVSKQGFIAATPFAEPARSETLIGSLLDDGQLDALDRTEPNYRRLLLSARDYPLEIDGSGERPVHWSVYESIHGVLCIDGTPARLGTQAALHAQLTAVGPIDAIAGLGTDSASALARLQQEPVREALKAQWREHGHAAPSGLIGERS